MEDNIINRTYILKLESGAIMSDTHDENEKQKVVPIRDSMSLDPPDSPDSSAPSDLPSPKKHSRLLSFFDKHKSGIISGTISGLAVLAISFAVKSIFFSSYEMNQLQAQMNDLTGLVQTQGNDIKEIKESLQNERLDRAEAISNSEKDMQKFVMDMIKLISPTELRSTDTMAQAIKICADTDDSFDSLPGNGEGKLTATTLVAYNVYTLEEYSVAEIANQRVLLPYLDGKKEGYFYGQLSETGAWDGDCIINIYENGKLIFIKEAVYDDGRLLSSRQVFSYSFNENQDVWAVSNRTNEGDHSEGETRIYKWERDYIQGFEREEVAPKDIIDIDTFQKSLNPKLYAYYYGSVSGEYFNDESGTSYMVHFFEDGTVRLLYVGNFENGHFNDMTGNAWYIVKEENTDYMYYRGKFKNDRVVERVSSLPPPLSLDQIKEIIGDRTFNVKLQWDKLDVT